MTRISARRSATNRRNVLKFCPDGFLPEEFGDRPGRPDGPSSRRQEILEIEEPSPTDRPYRWPWAPDAPSDGPAGDSSPLDPDRDLAELHALERRTARLLREGAADGPARGIEKALGRWFGTHVSSDGLALADPWRTYALAPALHRLRLALAGIRWSESLEASYRQLIESVYRIARPHGWLFANDAPVSPSMLEILTRFGRQAGCRGWHDVALSYWDVTGAAKRSAPPATGLQSDETGVAVLRRDWSKRAPVFAVDYRAEPCAVQYRVCGEMVLDGLWDTTVTIGKRAVSVTGDWTATCWYADEDGEYLELRVDLEKDLVLERQIFLSRRIGMLWLADTVKTDAPGPLELAWRLPTPTVTGSTGALPTRAQDALGVGFPLRFLPVGLPADPMASADGTFACGGAEITMSARSAGHRLFLPLAMSWDDRRAKKQAEWRHLTITNDRRLVPGDEAVAIRVPAGDRQAVFFRALRTTARYAFVGYQTYSECVIGEIDSAGELNEWLIVE